MSNQWFAAHQRNVHRLVLSYEIQNTVHQRIATEVAQLAQRHIAAQVHVPVGVAARTAERALARDFDREERHSSRKDTAPGRQDFSSSKTRTWNKSSRHGPPPDTRN